MKTFTWQIEKNASATHEFDVRVVQFGDGYEQRQPKSLRGKRQKWSVVVSGLADKIALVKAFLDEHRGVQAFYWTPPNGRKIAVKAAKYHEKHLGGKVYSLDCEFEEVLL
ncbi:phage tail protein [Wielerella bovis]|uniref:phage tail protein n=1 Tax=Wielerella bovis TaxID=2917790 RepID=UPI002018AF73|nr:phage tail protein [Wielerella bovis]ULJ67911.1 phage tail protein [Wielerella bovis]